MLQPVARNVCLFWRTVCEQFRGPLHPGCNGQAGRLASGARHLQVLWMQKVASDTVSAEDSTQPPGGKDVDSWRRQGVSNDYAREEIVVSRALGQSIHVDMAQGIARENIRVPLVEQVRKDQLIAYCGCEGGCHWDHGHLLYRLTQT